MKALALFGVLVVAKLLTLVGRELPWSAWTPFALFWQDALVALLFGALDFVLRGREAISWGLYCLIVGYTAVNVPIARVLSSPLTWQMSKATGGALSDSIMHYFTPATFAQMAAVFLAALGFAIMARRPRPIWTIIGFGALFVLALCGGAFAVQRIDCSGLHRNALVAFIESALPKVNGVAPTTPGDWRSSVAGAGNTDDLSSLRGAAAGRNVVLISLESTGARYLHCYGTSQDPTPNLTRLTETSLVFENAFAVTPESIKGLFSVLCSRYPTFDTDGEDYALVRTASIAQRLAREGYQTALFHSGRFMYLGMNAVVQQRGFETLEDAGAIGGNFNSSFGVDEPATVERMLAWIDALPAGQHFFLHYLPIAGHHPYATPERGPFPDSDDAGQYLNALHYGDAALGRLFEAFRHRGLDANTLFVIYGDHGEAFGQHEGNYGHTLFLYEENVHVPLFISMPGTMTESRRVKRIASLIDLAPTILDLLGLAAVPDYQGTSLLNHGERAALFFTDYALPLAGVRDGKWKLIARIGFPRAKLFDAEADPGETLNLAEQYPDFVAAWQRRLQDWASAQKALILRSEEAMSREVVARVSDGSDR
jgi:arylsulfatase A-like enzyme